MSTAANDPIRAYIVSEFLAGEDAEDLTDDFDLIESTVVNSLGLVRLISWISETY
ncbi:acyl carrier protein, partial [Streptomyces sp. SID7499]|nr:acyl carrier protein [Streptomyces sp. SID7499]